MTTKIVGVILEKEGGEWVFVPASNANADSNTKPETGGVVKAPTPEETRISKEKKADYTLKGVLKKHEKPS